MSYGIGVWDSDGRVALENSDLTFKKLLEVEIISNNRARARGHRSDYILLDVPGYTSASCFVLITPRVFKAQVTHVNEYFTPVFREVGFEQIGIITYTNFREIIFNGSQVNAWAEYPVHAVVEVIKVLA